MTNYEEETVCFICNNSRYMFYKWSCDVKRVVGAFIERVSAYGKVGRKLEHFG